MAAPSVLLFYTLVGEKGEAPVHPNCVRVPCLGPGGASRPRLGDVLAAWPLAGTGSFHFRFQVKIDDATLFADALDADEVLPLTGANLVARVLRLDALQCASRRAFALAPAPRAA